MVLGQHPPPRAAPGTTALIKAADIPQMEYRYLGKTGLKVSVISLGGWFPQGSRDAHVTAECMKVAYDAGVNYFDNAEAYANGQSEIEMGKAIKKFDWRRSDIVLSTKVFWGGSGPNDEGLSRKHIIEGLKASLERMELDYVDIVFAHRYDPKTPMEEIVRAFNFCIDKGMCFYWGTSEWSAAQIASARRIAANLKLVGPVVEQPEYNCLHRERVEKEYYPFYKSELGLGTTTWSPLASGVLTGKYNNGIPEGSRLSMDDSWSKSVRAQVATEEGKSKIEKVRKMTKVADRLGCTVAQLSLAWVIKNPNVSTMITGASKPAQVVENLKCLELLPKLTDDVMKELDGILGNKPENVEPFNFRRNFESHASH